MSTQIVIIVILKFVSSPFSSSRLSPATSSCDKIVIKNSKLDEKYGIIGTIGMGLNLLILKRKRGNQPEIRTL